jgi:hypothetical protein
LPTRRALDAIVEDFRQVGIGIEDLLVLLFFGGKIRLLFRAPGDDRPDEKNTQR